MGDQAKNHQMISLKIFNPLVSKHIKNLFKTSINKFFKCTKTNKLRNSGCLFDGFWSGPPIYVYY